MRSEPRHALIDALKAIISQIIVLHHLAFYGPMSDYAAPLAPELFAWLSQYARIAVQTFLVVGGFLAAQSLARDGTLVTRPLGQLLGKRFLKLVPPYLAALALALVGAAIARQLMVHDSIPEAPSLGQLLTHLVLLHGHFGFDGLSAGVWYIGIDFQLYALLCLTLWLAARAEGKDYVLGGSASNRLLIDPPSEAGGLAPVYGCITVDPDLNITVELSLDSAFAADSPYNTTISIQCTPTFDNQGRVTVIEYGDNTVVKKTEAA